ncbi:heavy-metal-associated domain-containing protein [Inquilinus limosus]|nr:heavy-metal-associated domain-containing protein [Inquilinus limosus]
MGATLSFRVEDMTCGHCAGTIKGAIEGSIPGARVEADPVRKLVSVTGTDESRGGSHRPLDGHGAARLAMTVLVRGDR